MALVTKKRHFLARNYVFWCSWRRNPFGAVALLNNRGKLTKTCLFISTAKQWCSPRDQSLGLEAPRGQKIKSWSWSWSWK